MTSADSTEKAPTPRWTWIAVGSIVLVIVGVVVLVANVLSSDSPDSAGSAPSAASAQNPAETTYMAIITNQGGLIADQATMVKLGRDACDSLRLQVGSADDSRQLALSQFVLSHDNMSMKEATAIVTAAAGSGLCTN